MPSKLTSEIITAAIEGFAAQKRHIDSQIAELRAMLPGGSAETTATPETAPTKRKISAAARRRMARGQKARWAKLRGEPEPLMPTPDPPTPKRKLSKVGRANIVAALKKRWAAKKAAASQVKPGATKKTAASRAVEIAPNKSK